MVSLIVPDLSFMSAYESVGERNSGLRRNTTILRGANVANSSLSSSPYGMLPSPDVVDGVKARSAVAASTSYNTVLSCSV